MSNNVQQIAEYVAANNGISKGAATIIVRDVFAFIKDSLVEGTEVNINDFGKFEVVAKPERQGRNPATGETITIAARNAAKFKPAKALRDAL